MLGVLSIIVLSACSPIVHDAMPIAYSHDYGVKHEWVKKKRRDRGSDWISIKLLRDLDQDEPIDFIALMPLYGESQQVTDHYRTYTIPMKDDIIEELGFVWEFSEFKFQPSFQGEKFSGIKLYFSPPSNQILQTTIIEFGMNNLGENNLDIFIRSIHFTSKKESKIRYRRFYEHLIVE